MGTTPPMRELNPTGTHIPSDGELLGRAVTELQALWAENERLRAVVKAARVLAQNYAVARDLDYHVRKVRDAVNELDAR